PRELNECAQSHVSGVLRPKRCAYTGRYDRYVVPWISTSAVSCDDTARCPHRCRQTPLLRRALHGRPPIRRAVNRRTTASRGSASTASAGVIPGDFPGPARPLSQPRGLVRAVPLSPREAKCARSQLSALSPSASRALLA